MPGAQPRRPFETRLMSSARRGAAVPNGAPGVYRVPRTRTVTVQGNDVGAATAAPPEWVQPEDVTGEIGAFSSFLISQYGTNGPEVDLNDWYSSGTSPGALYVANMGGPGVRWETVIAVVYASDLSMPPVSPTPPTGMSVEYEATSGTPLQLKLSGRLDMEEGGDGLVDPGSYEIREITASTLDPGHVGPYSTRVGPTRPWSGSPIYSHSGSLLGTPITFDTGYQTWPDGAPRIGWQFGEVHCLDETEAPEAGDGGVNYAITVLGASGDTGLTMTYDYRPPRYRFV